MRHGTRLGDQSVRGLKPTAIDLEDLTAIWGDLELRAAGELTLDSDGIATGENHGKRQ